MEPVYRAAGRFGYGKQSAGLVDIFQERLERLYHWNVSSGAILFVPGVVPGFNVVIRSLSKPHSEVLIQTPAYAPFLKAAGHADMSTRVEKLD